VHPSESGRTDDRTELDGAHLLLIVEAFGVVRNSLRMRKLKVTSAVGSVASGNQRAVRRRVIRISVTFIPSPSTKNLSREAPTAW
jgi:hypothetical protein